VCARLRRAAASASRTERTGKKKKVERCYKRQRGLALGLNAFITRFVGSQCCREQTHTHTISHCLRPLYCRCVYACERVGGGGRRRRRYTELIVGIKGNLVRRGVRVVKGEVVNITCKKEIMVAVVGTSGRREWRYYGNIDSFFYPPPLLCMCVCVMKLKGGRWPDRRQNTDGSAGSGKRKGGGCEK
jgi:hypothetical protein